MKKKLPRPPSRTQSRPAHARSVEDNYPEYLEHEYGYAYEVADVMSQAALEQHETLLHAEPQALEALELSELDDFQIWAVARAWRRAGRFDRFLEVTRRLLSSEDEHPVVIYAEISRWVAAELAGDGRLEEASELLVEHLNRWDNDLQARELAAVVDFLENDDDASIRRLGDEHPDDAELLYDIAEDLWRFDRLDAAGKWLDETRLVAERIGDEALIVDVELLETRIESGRDEG